MRLREFAHDLAELLRAGYVKTDEEGVNSLDSLLLGWWMSGRHYIFRLTPLDPVTHEFDGLGVVLEVGVPELDPEDEETDPEVRTWVTPTACFETAFDTWRFSVYPDQKYFEVWFDLKGNDETFCVARWNNTGV